MHDMVKRDRNEAAVVIWSFCNEYECEQVTNRTGLDFRAAAKALDPQRVVGANGDTDGLDVQGHSHANNATFVAFHEANPTVPQVLSECCSCTSQRANGRQGGGRDGLPSCIWEQNSPGLLPFVAGSLGVWTLTARQHFAEHFFRSNAPHCTATARILIPAECSAVS